MRSDGRLTVRRVRFAIDEVAPDWHPRLPEFAAGANAISLLMPYAEPFVISAVRNAAAQIADPELQAAAETWASQEAAHYRLHRRFNRSLIHKSNMAALLDRTGGRVFDRLRRRSPGFGLAFAAAFELIAFCSARWTDKHMVQLLSGADDVAASMFLWHLAEEVEHKGIVHSVERHAAIGRSSRLAGLVSAFVVLIGFTTLGGLLLFATSRSALNPVRWFRLIGWGLGLAFALLPVLAASLFEDFDPARLVDPPWMAMWLREFDPVTETLPVWTGAGLDARPPAGSIEPLTGRPQGA